MHVSVRKGECRLSMGHQATMLVDNTSPGPGTGPGTGPGIAPRPAATHTLFFMGHTVGADHYDARRAMMRLGAMDGVER